MINENNQPEERSTAELISQYAGLFLRWSWLLILMALLAGGGAYYYSNRQPRVYQASTLLMVNGAPGVSSESYSSLYYVQQLLSTYAITMTTQPMLEKVAEELGMEYLPASVTVAPVQDTNLLKITVTGSDPDMVALIANTMYRIFADDLQADQAGRYADSKKSLETQMASLDLQIQNTTNNYLDVSQKVYEIQTELDELTQDIADTTKLYGAEAVSPDDQSRQTQLQTSLLQYQLQQTQLQSSLSQYQYSYNILTQSYNSVNLAEAQSRSLVIQKDPATPPTAPIQPQPVRSALLAAVVGLLLAAGIVFLIEFLDDTVRDPQEITRTWGVPVLGMIVNFDSNKSEIITSTQPRSPVSEAFRSLRTNLQFASVAAPVKTLLVTSASPKDGKTTIVANLGTVLAQMGRKVVVVDADLRRPRVHKIFQLHNRLGLTDQFIHPQDHLDGTVKATEVKDLFAVTSGALPPNPSELLGSERMTEIIGHLGQEFTTILLDTPPILFVTDALVLAPVVDGVLLVVKPSVTKRAEIRHAIEQLKRVNANLLGVIINDVRVDRSRYYYYRGYSYSNRSRYGKGYGYGEKEFEAKVNAAPKSADKE